MIIFTARYVKFNCIRFSVIFRLNVYRGIVCLLLLLLSLTFWLFYSARYNKHYVFLVDLVCPECLIQNKGWKLLWVRENFQPSICIKVLFCSQIFIYGLFKLCVCWILHRSYLVSEKLDLVFELILLLNLYQ